MRAVSSTGKRLRTAHLDVRVVRSPGAESRVGFIVAKYAHTAVARNRVKRMLRELTRTHLLGALRALPHGAAADVVIRARPEAYRATPAALAAELIDLSARISLHVAAADGPAAARDTGTAGGA